MSEWFDAMRAKGHVPKMSSGDLDIFVLDEGFHNGPGCETCGWSCCWHCEGIDDIPPCSNPPLELEVTELSQRPLRIGTTP